MSTQLALCNASGPLTDLLQKLSGQNGRKWLRALNQMLRKENPWVLSEILKVAFDGRSGEIIYDGRTGEELVLDLENDGVIVPVPVKEVICSQVHMRAKNTIYKLATIFSRELKCDPSNRNILTEANNRGYLIPPIVVALLVREVLSRKNLMKLGLAGLIVMNEVAFSANRSSYLGLFSDKDSDCLYAFPSHPDKDWSDNFGFVFLAPEES